MKLIGSSVSLLGAGGAPAPIIREVSEADVHVETVEIGKLVEIGKAICQWQALLRACESIRLRFTTGGRWMGGCTITCDDEDSTYTVEGRIFYGSGDDDGTNLYFVGEGDGPIGLPLRAASGHLFTDEEDLMPWEASCGRDSAVIGGLCEDGAMVSRANAGKAKRVDGEKLSSGRKLARQADEASTRWFRVVDAKLVEMTPKTEVWPQPMPKPAKNERGTKTAPVASSGTKKGYVHKRTTAGRVVAL